MTLGPVPIGLAPADLAEPAPADPVPAVPALAGLEPDLLSAADSVLGILKRKAAFEMRNTFSFCSVMMDVLAVIPGKSFRSVFCALNNTV